MRKITEALIIFICVILFSCDQKLDIEPAQSISVDKALSGGKHNKKYINWDL